MIIVFVRHAAAEENSTEKEDMYRNLTSFGVNEFKVTAEALSLLFPENTHIMTSPLIRAQQTANILKQYIGDTEIEICDELVSADLDSFIQKCNSKTETIFAVGHEPFLSTWLLNLTGKEQHFKKSSIAVIEINNEDKCKFITYSEPASLLRLINKEFPLKQFSQLLKLRIQILHGNYNEDIIHELRVAIRQIKIILYNLKPLLPIENLTKTLSEISYLFEYTNKVRDYDVLINFIQTSDNFSQELLVFITEKKKEKLSEFLTVMHEERIILVFLNLFMLLEFKDMKICKKTVKNRFLPLIKRTHKIASKIDINDELALHRLRISCKKIYYSLDIFPFAEKLCSSKTAKQSKLLKDTLGLKHDLFISQMLLEDCMSAQSNEIQVQARQMATQLLKNKINRDELEKLLKKFKASL